jgi:hypothetical protein
MSLSRRLAADLGAGTLSALPSLAAALGTSSTDTTWSATSALTLAWEQGDWSLSASGSGQMRSWESSEFAGSAAVQRTFTPTLDLTVAAGTARLSGSWTRATLDWSRQGQTWGGGLALGAGYLWDVEVASTAKGSRSNQVRTTTADQIQLLPSGFVTARSGAWDASLHLDADLRSYEATKGSKGKGKNASGTTATVTSLVLDPWAQAGWSAGAWGVDLSGGWSQDLSMGGGESTAGAWAALSTSLSW